MTTIDALHAARDFIDRHFADPLSVDEMAARAHLSRYHFIRAFHREFFETPHQYLTRKRIEKAKALLANSERTVTHICFAVGFNSVGSFSTLFRKTVGWSPSAYRARTWAQLREPLKFIPGCHLVMRERVMREV